MFDMFKNEHSEQQKETVFMVLNERQEKIEEYLNEHKHASVRKLASTFFVSEMTIRRDLKAMEKAGYLLRYNGGASCIADNGVLPFTMRKFFHEEHKTHIAEAVRPYLDDNLSVYIDTSSTCFYVIPTLAEYKGITIITNSLFAAISAADYHIPCKLAGGQTYEADLCTIGASAVDYMRSVNPDVAFFSLQAISDDGLITDSNAEQVEVRRAIFPNCQKKVVILDESKRHKTSTYTFCSADEADAVLFI